MKASMGLAALLLAAACVPAGAAGSGGVARRDPLASLVLAGAGPVKGAPAAASLTLPPLARGDWRGATVFPCSLGTAVALAVTLPPAAAPVYPSLGGPSRTLTPADALPSLRDETRQTDQEDTLRFLRSRW